MYVSLTHWHTKNLTALTCTCIYVWWVLIRISALHQWIHACPGQILLVYGESWAWTVVRSRHRSRQPRSTSKERNRHTVCRNRALHRCFEPKYVLLKYNVMCNRFTEDTCLPRWPFYLIIKCSSCNSRIVLIFMKLKGRLTSAVSVVLLPIGVAKKVCCHRWCFYNWCNWQAA